MSTIYIVSNNGKLQKKGETLQLNYPDGMITTIFPYKTEQIVVLGSIEITGSAFRLLMKYNIDTIFLGTNGKFNGKLVFQESKNIFLRQRQFKLLDDNSFRLNFAKAVVSGKLKNQLTFMQRINRRSNEIEAKIKQTIENMKRIIQKVDDATDLNMVRGYEGIGAKYFFSVFRENIKQDWAIFKGRSMHPPEDNVNAVLSFLYTLLLYRVDAAIEEEGLDAYVGYFHELEYGKRTLSFDLMEEFRTPLADTLCCALFNLGMLNETDFREVVFSSDSDEYPLAADEIDTDNIENISYQSKKGILLTKDGIQKVITQFEKKIETQIFYQLQARNISYKKIIQEQVKHFRRIINGEEREYKPLISK